MDCLLCGVIRESMGSALDLSYVWSYLAPLAPRDRSAFHIPLTPIYCHTPLTLDDWSFSNEVSRTTHWSNAKILQVAANTQSQVVSAEGHKHTAVVQLSFSLISQHESFWRFSKQTHSRDSERQLVRARVSVKLMIHVDVALHCMSRRESALIYTTYLLLLL